MTERMDIFDELPIKSVLTEKNPQVWDRIDIEKLDALRVTR